MLQFVAEQLPQADEAEEDGICPTLSELDPFVLKANDEIIFARFLLAHEGHDGASFPNTSASKLFLQSLHLYSYIGILFPKLILWSYFLT